MRGRVHTATQLFYFEKLFKVRNQCGSAHYGPDDISPHYFVVYTINID
jgi:hypothetical protein